jgi:hydrogenase maturation protease
MTGPVRVIGLGSPYGDDRAGWAVIDRLAAWEQPVPADLLRCTDPALDLLPALVDARRVLLVDAVDCGAPPGTVDLWRGEAIGVVRSALSSHGLDAGQVLALGTRLGMVPDDLTLYGIAVDPAACGPEQSSMSTLVAGAVETAAARIFADIQAAAAGTVQPTVDEIGVRPAQRDRGNHDSGD